MKRTIIIILIVIVAILLCVGVYFLFFSGSGTSSINNQPSGGQLGTLPTTTIAGPVLASDIFSNLPTSTYLSIGTASGTVQINNFYLSDPPVDDGGDIVIKQTANYVISYDPTDSSFWIGISSIPFSTWQSPAEQDFLTTIGVSETDACKLSVTEGVVYSANNPDDGMSFPLSFCSGGAF